MTEQVKRCGVAFEVSEAETEIRAAGKYLKQKSLNDLLAVMSNNYRAQDAGLRFVHPKEPALVILNLADTVVRDVKYTVVLWNADLPERDDPLPIPVGAFDWLKARASSAPNNLFDRFAKPFLRPGNRLFGSASATCPYCVRGHTYFVYIVWGVGGWYSEVRTEKSGSLIVPVKVSKETREAFLKYITDIPEASRVVIAEH